MRVLDVLDMTRSTARCLDSCRAFILIEDLGVVTPPTGRARINPVDVGAHVACFMTTTARHDLRGYIDVFNSVDTGDNPNAVDVDGVKLSISPLLRLVGRNLVLLQERCQFRLRLQFFRIQALPNPHAINYRITESATVGSMNALAVVMTLVVVVMTFSARLQRRIHRLEVLTSMFCVAGCAGDTCVAVFGNDSSSEVFGLMTGRAICIHLFLVRHANSDSVAGGA